MATLALAGCIPTGDQVAMGPRSDVDAMAYGQPANDASSRNAYAAATPVAYHLMPNINVESAVAIAGGFSPRAERDSVTLTHNAGRVVVPLGTPIGPGDTVLVGERWF